MRKDMAKVIIDTYRSGDYRTYSNFRVKEVDEEYDGPRHESMRKIYRQNWGGKEFGDRLNPLWRFLDKQVGRPWNKVWSEICKNTDGRHESGGHLKRHILNYVTENTIVKDGKVFNTQYSNFELSNGSLYVDAKGFLRKYKNSSRKRYRRPKTTSKIVVIDKREFFQHEGLWYEVEMVSIQNLSSLSPAELRSLYGGDRFGVHASGIFLDEEYRVKYKKPTRYYWSDSRAMEVYGERSLCLKRKSANSKDIKRIEKELAA